MTTQEWSALGSRWLVTTDVNTQPKLYDERIDAYGDALTRAMHHMPVSSVSIQCESLPTYTSLLMLSRDRNIVVVAPCVACIQQECERHTREHFNG